MANTNMWSRPEDEAKPAPVAAATVAGAVLVAPPVASVEVAPAPVAAPVVAPVVSEAEAAHQTLLQKIAAEVSHLEQEVVDAIKG